MAKAKKRRSPRLTAEERIYKIFVEMLPFYEKLMKEAFKQRKKGGHKTKRPRKRR